MNRQGTEQTHAWRDCRTLHTHFGTPLSQTMGYRSQSTQIKEEHELTEWEKMQPARQRSLIGNGTRSSAERARTGQEAKKKYGRGKRETGGGEGDAIKARKRRFLGIVTLCLSQGRCHPEVERTSAKKESTYATKSDPRKNDSGWGWERDRWALTAEGKGGTALEGIQQKKKITGPVTWHIFFRHSQAYEKGMSGKRVRKQAGAIADNGEMGVAFVDKNHCLLRCRVGQRAIRAGKLTVPVNIFWGGGGCESCPTPQRKSHRTQAG